MEFQGLETSVVEVLRADEIQRLRRIRQLGLTHLVFPGAEHSRLVHSLGAAHLAVRFGRQLGEGAREFLGPSFQLGESGIRDFALATLCHDLGHGPLSHVWEREVVGDDYDRRKWCDSLELSWDPRFANLAWHELVAQGLLLWEEGQLHTLLETQEVGRSTRLAHLLTGTYYIPYVPRLISGDVDVDRCDFILRDAHLTGVAYGLYDLNWLVSAATVGITHDDDLVVGFDQRKAPRVVEQLLIARRAMYEVVYLHKTVRSAEGMVGNFLRRLREVVKETGWFIADKSHFFAPFQKSIEGGVLGPHEILGLDDYALWVLIRYCRDLDGVDPTLADLARRLVERDLFKEVGRSSDSIKRFFQKHKTDAYDRLFTAARPFCAGVPDFYFVDDVPEFQMLHSDPRSMSFFVDPHDSERPALPIREYDEFHAYLKDSEQPRRLYCPGEALEAVERAIDDR